MLDLDGFASNRYKNKRKQSNAQTYLTCSNIFFKLLFLSPKIPTYLCATALAKAASPVYLTFISWEEIYRIFYTTPSAFLFGCYFPVIY